MKTRLFDIDNWKEIGATLARNKTRTFLTGFGIFWGVFMLAILLGGARGAKDLLMRNFAGFATNSGFIFTGNTSVPYKGHQKGRSWDMDVTDLERIRTGVPELQTVTEMYSYGGVSFRNGKYSYSGNVIGASPDYCDVMVPVIYSGRFVNTADVSRERKVAVVGQKVANELFPGVPSPVGREVEVNGIAYTIVGVAGQTSEVSMGGRLDESVVLPSSTFRRAFRRGDTVDGIMLVARDGVKISGLENRIRRLLYVRHSIAPDDLSAMDLFDISERFEMVDNLFLGVSMLALFIGLSTLLAGIIGIVRQSRIIRQAVGLAVSELGGGKKGADTTERTQRDITMKRILSLLIATLVCVFVFFHFGLLDGWVQSVTAILIVFVISFLFTTVAANAIAIVGSNPVSGMTLMTLILSSLVLVAVGLNGTTGMTAALIIGGVVCTALSMAGGFITDLKIGYWLGTTPCKQETWKFLGTFVSAATVAGVMIVLNKSYGFVGEGALVAPQANAMAAVIQPLMTGGQTPWMLYFCGAALALVLTAIGVPALAFALGMFIPMELNAPLVVGGLVSWYVSTRSKDQALNKARMDRGTLIASGFIAGGALMGVVSAILKFCEVDWFLSDWASSNAAEWTGLVMYLVLIGYFSWHTLRARKEE